MQINLTCMTSCQDKYINHQSRTSSINPLMTNAWTKAYSIEIKVVLTSVAPSFWGFIDTAISVPHYI